MKKKIGKILLFKDYLTNNSLFQKYLRTFFFTLSEFIILNIFESLRRGSNMYACSQILIKFLNNVFKFIFHSKLLKKPSSFNPKFKNKYNE